MIVEKILETKQAKIKQYPVNANRASELGHECLRYLVLNRTRWEEKTLHDARVQMIFDIGNTIEDLVENNLREAGFQIVEQHRPFQWREYQITGSIDMKVKLNDKVYPCEVKSSSPFVFDSINTIQDIRNHKYHYMRKYLAQLTLYMLMDNKDDGVFLFMNKSTGAMKEIWYSLDYDFAESLVKKAEVINQHVADNTLPDAIPYDDMICGDCGFQHICLPERIGKEIEVLDDELLKELLEQRENLMQSARDYERIDKQIKELIKGKDKLLVGDWFITGKWIDKTSYNVPDDIKQQYKENKPYWKPSFVKTTGEIKMGVE